MPFIHKATSLAGGEVLIGCLTDPFWKTLPNVLTALDQREAGTHADPARFLKRRSLFRHWLAAQFGVRVEKIELGHGAHGRPYWVNGAPSIYLSQSARGDYFVFGSARQPFGLDLEVLSDAEMLPNSVLTPNEQVELNKIADARQKYHQFLRLWTLKEAFLKAKGLGLLQDPATIEICFMPDDLIEISDQTNRRLRISAALIKISLCCQEMIVSAVSFLERDDVRARWH